MADRCCSSYTYAYKDLKHMEDSSLFMQWAMNMLQQEHPAPAVDDVCGQATSPALQPLPEEASHATETVRESLITGTHAATGWSSRGTSSLGDHVSANFTWHAGPAGGGSGIGTNSLPAVSWNFSAVSAELASDGTRGLPPLPELAAAYGSPTAPVRRAGLSKSTRSTSTPTSSSAYAQEHIIAERKRREKINQRFVELSAVIPGLKKMDKATILSDATRYVKELREKLSARDDAAGVVISRSSGTVVLVKRACYAPPADDEEVAPAAARKPLPEIDARLSGNNVMVRVICENGRGVAARVLAEVEDLHLSIVDANVIPSPACALNITITAKVEAAFIVTAEEIIGRVSSALSQQQHTK